MYMKSGYFGNYSLFNNAQLSNTFITNFSLLSLFKYFEIMMLSIKGILSLASKFHISRIVSNILLFKIYRDTCRAEFLTFYYLK